MSRETNVVLNWLLNELMPPFLRDSKLLFRPIFRLVFGKRAALFFDFHDRVYRMSDAEFAALNLAVQPALIQRPTDLNQACIRFIQQNVQGRNVLDVGCGKGYLSRVLARSHDVTAVDIALAPELKKERGFKIVECNVESLPFADRSFDSVICVHTLEHVRNIQQTLAELRRVCRGRLIIVVPCDRPYLYTFNLHIHFFPYAYNFLAITGIRPGQSLQKRGGDWVYVEESEIAHLAVSNHDVNG